ERLAVNRRPIRRAVSTAGFGGRRSFRIERFDKHGLATSSRPPRGANAPIVQRVPFAIGVVRTPIRSAHSKGKHRGPQPDRQTIDRLTAARLVASLPLPTGHVMLT